MIYSLDSGPRCLVLHPTQVESIANMLTRTIYASSLLSALQFAAAAPAPQVAGYTDADASFSVTQPTGSLATSFSPDSQVPVSCDYGLYSFNVLILPRRYQRLLLPRARWQHLQG
jgi:hypothetical protein